MSVRLQPKYQPKSGGGVEKQKERLLLTAGERPASVFFRGVEVRIDVHDAWYERTLKRLKADIVAHHPDSTLSGLRRRIGGKKSRGVRFIIAQKHMKTWMAKQEKWYQELGLKPPRVIGMAKVTAPLYAKAGDDYIAPDSSKYKDAVAEQRTIDKKRNKTKE